MDRLRHQRNTIRSAATHVIAAATEALQETEPTHTDLQVLLNELGDKDHGLAEINAKIEELVIDDNEFEAEFTETLEYHEMICHSISRVCSNMNFRAVIGWLLTVASPLRGQEAVHTGGRYGNQPSVSAKAAASSQYVQQPKLKTEGSVQRPLFLENDKAIAAEPRAR